METRQLGAESIIAAPRRQDRWKRGGERAALRFRRRVLPGGRDPGPRPMTPADVGLSNLPSPAPRPMSRPLRGGRTALLAPPGPFDGTAAELLTRDARALILTGCRSFILDLRHSDYVDTQGARGLLSLRSEVSRRGGRVRLVVAEGSRVERMLRLLDFGALFPIFRAAEETCRA
jgi:anti-anti-sigma factor